MVQRYADSRVLCQRTSAPDSEGERVVEMHSSTAVWRHGGMPIVPIRGALLRDPQGRFDPQALLCTDTAREPLQIVAWFGVVQQVPVSGSTGSR